MTIRTLIVDDEDVARRGLRARLKHIADFEVIGECSNGAEALAAIRRLTPDLIFLDIRMPETSGLDLIQSLAGHSPPRIVFVTAFDEYAVRAFEVNALDYLLKPIDEHRLAATLERVRRALADGTAEGYARRLAESLAAIARSTPSSQPKPGTDRIAVPTGDKVTILQVADVDWVSASGNYVSLQVGKKAWLLRETVSAIEERLGSHGFVRIHRSTLVNVQRVVELRSLDNGEFSVTLNDGTVLKLSRGYRAALDQLIGRR